MGWVIILVWIIRGSAFPRELDVPSGLDYPS